MRALLHISIAAALGWASAASAFQVTTTPVTTAPSVPAGAGTPCVVNLFQDVILYEEGQSPPYFPTSYTYSPPAGCQGPWAKVVLKVRVNETAAGGFTDASKAYISLGGVQIYEGSMSNLPSQQATPPPNPIWEAERDVTDIASLLTTAQNGAVDLFPEQSIWASNMTNEQVGVSAQLLFYPASAANPAQETPDAVYGVLPTANTVSLPHNIVRAYLDIYNQEPWWFTCVTNQEVKGKLPFFSALALGGSNRLGIFAPSEGCGGGSFAEIEVSIDGTPAGVAPAFPLLSSNLNFAFSALENAPGTNLINAPVQPPQMLNYIPYRVDLTPFAAILNRVGAHTISLSRPDIANLLIYQDQGSTYVSGAVTLNTLAGSAGSPTVTDTIQSVNDSASGQITTSLDRNFTIQGFVNTSSGRVDSSVQQTSHFQNTQDLYLDGLAFPNYREYRQHLRLASQTLQHSQRTKAGSVLNDDVLAASYPLDLLYDMYGYVFQSDEPEAYPSTGSVSVQQHRDLAAVYLKNGSGSYGSLVNDGFVSSRTHNLLTRQDSQWQAQADYQFYDTQGSCYQSGLTALNGAVATQTHGVGCPNGQNAVLWFAHPDGSPDSLGWEH